MLSTDHLLFLTAFLDVFLTAFFFAAFLTVFFFTGPQHPQGMFSPPLKKRKVFMFISFCSPDEEMPKMRLTKN